MIGYVRHVRLKQLRAELRRLIVLSSYIVFVAIEQYLSHLLHMHLNIYFSPC